MKRTSIKLIIALGLSCFGGLSANAETNLTAETASPGLAPHLTILHLADVAGAQGIANLQVLEGQTLTNSIKNVAEGKSDIAAAPIFLTFLMSKGRGPYSALGAAGEALASNIRALYPYNAGSVTLIAHESSGITKWDDIKGKTIFNGPPRGGALLNARLATQLVTGYKDGSDYQGHQVNWGQLPSLLVDGTVDAFVMPTTFPAAQVTVALAAGKVRIFSTPKEIFESETYRKAFNTPGTIPIVIKEEDMGYTDGQGVTLISEDGVFRGLGSAFAEIVNVNMSFDLAKALTAAHISTLDELKAKTPYAKNIGLAVMDIEKSGICGASKLKYHAGAVAAWEDAGYSIPDCAK